MRLVRVNHSRHFEGNEQKQSSHSVGGEIVSGQQTVLGDQPGSCELFSSLWEVVPYTMNEAEKRKQLVL